MRVGHRNREDFVCKEAALTSEHSHADVGLCTGGLAMQVLFSFLISMKQRTH